MKRFFFYLIVSLAASACSTVRQIPVVDSTRVEVRTETVTVHDTAYVELPVIVEKIQTLDTCSVLENKYAKSAASVSGGVLAHSLETKPVREPVTVEKQIVYKDSLVYRDRIVRETVEVEKKLTAWQTFKMKCGGISLLAIVLLIVITILYHVSPIKFNSR
jgi:hypothetical protein